MTIGTDHLVYLLLRFALSIFTAIAASMFIPLTWQAYRAGQRWWVAAMLAVLLSAAAVLSVYDAAARVVLRPQATISMANWLWLLLVDFLMPLVAIQAARLRKERDDLISQLSELAVTDPLTGLLNRRGFSDRALVAIAQARRFGVPVSLTMFDIDHFKAINDSYGHAAGDQVLQTLAKCLLEERRTGDWVSRVGGEEFAFLQIATDEELGVVGAERLRAAVKLTVPHPAGPEAQVTISGGVALVDTDLEPEASLVIAFKAADAALYAAKRAGRDQIMAATLALSRP